MTCGPAINANGMVSVLRDLLPNINPQIADLTYKEGTFLYDLLPMKTTPYFNGDTFFKQVYYGYQSVNPFQEDWTEIRRSVSATSHNPAHDACGTKWHQRKDGAEMIGWGLKKKSIQTEAFCLDDWAYAHYAPEFIQGKMDSLAGVVQGELENFAIAELFKMAQKFVIPRQGGFYQANTTTEWPVIPSGTPLSRLSIDLFTKLHTRMVNNRVPAGLQIGGGKAFFAIGNAEDISDFLYHDPNLAQDTRFSSMADDRLLKYNITDQFRGLFAFVNYYMMPRADIDADGNVEYIFPFDNNVPTQIGVRNAENPRYYSAKYHTMMFIGQAPAAIVKPGNAEGMVEAFRPKNPDFNWQLAIDPCSYPKNNKVWFWTEATLGWEPGNYPYVYVGLFRRRDESFMPADYGSPTCIVEPTVCSDTIPAQDCPCPLVIGTKPGFADTNLIFTLDVAVAGLGATDPVSFTLANGGVATGVVAQISADGLTLEVTFAGATVSNIPGWYVSVLCEVNGGCSSEVAKVTNCDSTADQVTLTLFNPLIALTVGDLVTATFCDGYTFDIGYVSANTASLQYVFTAPGASVIETLICEHGTICSLCVVPTVGNGCPACGPTYTACE
jgi:hypothetical protein